MTRTVDAIHAAPAGPALLRMVWLDRSGREVLPAQSADRNIELLIPTQRLGAEIRAPLALDVFLTDLEHGWK